MAKKLSDTTKNVAEKALARAESYKRAFTSKEGKLVLLDLMKEHYMLTTVFQGREEALGIAFRDGQRNVILRILTIMGLDTAEIYMLLKEGEKNANKTD